MSSDQQVTFQLLTTADDRAFEDFYRIYAESVEAREQKPRKQIAAMAARRDYEILLAKRAGRVIGGSVLFLPAGEPFCLLEYMAVQAEHRSTGVGAALFRRSLEAARSVQGESPVLLEVDSDRSPSPDQAIRQRRQRFYRRLGCTRVAGLSYLLPLPAAGPPPEMDLLIHLPSAMPSLPKASLERWLGVVYERVYGCPADDPRIGRMLAPVADPVGLV
jgi:GNAT superfamily N-acetyltransferase